MALNPNQLTVKVNKSFNNINDGTVLSMCLPNENFSAHGKIKDTKILEIDFSEYWDSVGEYWNSTRYSPQLVKKIKSLPFYKAKEEEIINYFQRIISENNKLEDFNNLKAFLVCFEHPRNHFMIHDVLRIGHVKEEEKTYLLEAWRRNKGVINQNEYTIFEVSLEHLKKKCQENKVLGIFWWNLMGAYLREICSGQCKRLDNEKYLVVQR